MKAGIAAMVGAMQMAQRKGFRPRGTVILAAVADEEVDQTGTRYLGSIGLKAIMPWLQNRPASNQ